MAGPKTEAALAALQSGDSIDAIEASEPQVEETSDEVVEQVDSEPELVESSDEAIQDESQEGDLSEDASEGDDDTVENPDVEEIIVNGRKVELDYSNREQIKKYAKQAGGFRKMQAERDDALKWKKEVEPELSELKKFESTIEGAYEDAGIEGIARLLAGSETAYQEWKDREVQKELAKMNATPAELEKIELQEQLEREKRERERLKKQREKELAEREADREKRELSDLQSKLDKGFNKWNFAGKLGDADMEESINSMIWEKAKAEIAEIPDDQELTYQMVDKAFRTAANSFRKFSKTQGRKVASESIQNSKKQAASKAALLASKGVGTAQTNDVVRDGIRKGDIRGSFYNFLDTLKK